MALSADELRLAVDKVRTDGSVVFPAVLPSELIERLHREFMTVFTDYITGTEQNRGANRYQMHLPFRPPFCDEAVICNPLAMAVIDSILGSDCICHYFASDTPLPGSDYQRVHSDIHPLFPESDVTVPAYGLVLNIPLVDFTPDNGPVEIWPGGTHLMPRGVDIAALAPAMHHEPVLMPAGSLLIRDLRMWHRGTPNRSDQPRPNLALIYARHWFRTKYPPIPIPPDVYASLSERWRELLRLEAIGAAG